jgi:tripartite-type tricarboxylate transporter receptor subunit TctC
MVQIMQSDAIKQRMGSVGFIIPTQGAKHYAAFMQSEIATWSKVIKVAGIKPQ